MTAVSQPPPPVVSENGSSPLGRVLRGRSQPEGPRSVGLPTPPRRQRNTTWLLIGALLVVGSGIAALSMASSLSERVDVVVAARDISEGEVVTVDDFSVAAVGLSGGVVAVNPADIPDLAGKVAAGPLGEGAIVHPDYFLGGLGDGTKAVIVGVDLGPGEYPRVGMLPGDEMIVIAVAEQSFGELSDGSREIGEGEVVEVVPLSQADSFLVSLRVDSSIATLVATLSNEDRVALALKELTDTETGVRPLSPVAPAEPLSNSAEESDSDSADESDADTGGATESDDG